MNHEEIEAMAKAANVPLTVIGSVCGESLVVRRSRQMGGAACSDDSVESIREVALEIGISEILRIYQEACSWLTNEG
ncbi:MAG TPA: hypothetical protein DCX02_05335 [Firmicutes bacterium]|nr:hypothetical protein [Bacillota bacterium]